MAFATRIKSAGFWGVRKTGKNKPWKNPGNKDQPRRDGHGKSVVTTHSCYVQSEMLNEANARNSQTSGRAKINFLPPLKTLYWIRKVSKPWYSDFTPDLKNCDNVDVLAGVLYWPWHILQSFTKEPCEGGRGGSRFRLPRRVGSVNSYVFSRVASQVGFSKILELRFQKVKIRIFLSNCWTWTSFFLDFLFGLHNCTPSSHLRAVFYNIPHRWIELFAWADWLI